MERLIDPASPEGSRRGYGRGGVSVHYRVGRRLNRQFVGAAGSSKAVVLTIKADSKASEAVVDVEIIASGGGKTRRRDIRLVVLR